MSALWLLSPTVSWAVDFSRNRHNTYKIYKHVFWHLLEGRNLYLPDPGKYGDVNLYGPLFSLIMAPFAMLPDVAGGLLWNVATAVALYLAIGHMGLAKERRLLLLLVCSVELMNANWSNQFNPAIAAFLLLTFASVEDGRDFLAPLWVLIGAFVKVYSVVGLLFLLLRAEQEGLPGRLRRLDGGAVRGAHGHLLAGVRAPGLPGLGRRPGGEERPQRRALHLAGHLDPGRRPARDRRAAAGDLVPCWAASRWCWRRWCGSGSTATGRSGSWSWPPC